MSARRSSHRRDFVPCSWATLVAVVAAAGLQAGCASGTTAQPASRSPDPIVTPELRITPGSTAEIEKAFHHAQDLLLKGDERGAIAAFEKVVAADPHGQAAGPSLFNMGLAYVSLGDHAKAAELFLDTERRFPDALIAKPALVRASRELGALERWADLEGVARRIDRRADLTVIERIEALGALGLALVEQGRTDEAFKAIVQGRDMVEEHKLGQAGTPPLELAQLAFALGEWRRIDSEKVGFDPMPVDFAATLEDRSTRLLSAQDAYSDAMRSLDAHWSAMAGYRVGQLYQRLHRDVMSAPFKPKDLKQQQLFEGAMRLRYRILLEKGLAMMDGTVRLGQRTGENSAWIARAKEAKAQLERSLADEKAALAKLPYTEEELREALGKLKKP
jgi:tetratricopeptide (TPR) repeat protein